MHEKYSYRIIWSEEDQEYVGLCTELPSLSWLSPNQTEAFNGIMKLAAGVIQYMEKEGEQSQNRFLRKNIVENLL